MMQYSAHTNHGINANKCKGFTISKINFHKLLSSVYESTFNLLKLIIKFQFEPISDELIK